MIGKNLYQDELIKVIEDSGLRKYVAGTQYKLEFKDLMRFRVDKILLVCSLYDYYIIVDDGHLQEAIFSEYLELNLHYAPHITHTPLCLKDMSGNIPLATKIYQLLFHPNKLIKASIFLHCLLQASQTV
jgi:hypothetical protein